MSASENCGYLHTQVTKSAETSTSLCLTINNDRHYSQYFEAHETRWSIHLTNFARSKFEDKIPDKTDSNNSQGYGTAPGIY
jgi:hypothetical protein